jgi:cytochrome c oxidase subunit 2
LALLIDYSRSRFFPSETGHGKAESIPAGRKKVPPGVAGEALFSRQLGLLPVERKAGFADKRNCRPQLKLLRLSIKFKNSSISLISKRGIGCLLFGVDTMGVAPPDLTSILSPGTKQAEEILRLMYLMLGVAGFILAVVAALVVYASIKYRYRPGWRHPQPMAESLKLEVFWTIVPGLIVSGLFVATVLVMKEVNPPVRDHRPDLHVIAHQWWWELHYPKSGVTAANEIHLPVGPPLLLRLESADVVHDFWVPALGKKVDIFPNHPNHLWLTIERPGTYLGTCDEFCGAEHAWMRIRVIAESPQDFQHWLARQSRPAAPPSGPEAQRGAAFFLSRPCANCHTIKGTPARATLGPDLTHLDSRTTLASGVMPNTPENLFRWLKNPQAIKPGCLMPNLHLSDAQVGDLVAYLGDLP